MALNRTFGATTYYAHEDGVNKIDLNGASSAITAFVQSGDFDLPIDGDGEFLLHVRRFLPDFKNLQGNADITIGTKNFPTATLNTSVSFVVSTTTDKVDTRIRGRLANIKIQCDDVDETWRFGTFRADVEPDGRR